MRTNWIYSIYSHIILLFSMSVLLFLNNYFTGLTLVLSGRIKTT